MGDFLPYFSVFPAETISDERYAGWTPEERGVWFHLLLHAWVNESIPNDEPSLARLNGMRPAAFRKVWARIGDRFIAHPDQPGRLTSRRLELAREKALRKSKASKEAAESRWGKERQCDRNANASPEPDADAMRTHSDGSAVAMPTTQSITAQHNAPQIAGGTRPVRLGVGSPAYTAVTHWRDRAWPSMSPADCPDVTAEQAQSLIGLVTKHGEAEVLAAMDRAAADSYWRDKLDLGTFIAKFPRFLPRNPSPDAKDPRVGRMDPAAAPAFVGGERDLTRV